MTTSIDIDIDLSQYSREELRSGSITYTLDLNDYELISEDDAMEFVDEEEFLSTVDDDSLIKELESRMTIRDEDVPDKAQRIIDKSPASALEFLQDILGMQHTCSCDDVLNEISRRIR